MCYATSACAQVWCAEGRVRELPRTVPSIERDTVAISIRAPVDGAPKGEPTNENRRGRLQAFLAGAQLSGGGRLPCYWSGGKGARGSAAAPSRSALRRHLHFPVPEFRSSAEPPLPPPVLGLGHLFPSGVPLPVPDYPARLSAAARRHGSAVASLSVGAASILQSDSGPPPPSLVWQHLQPSSTIPPKPAEPRRINRILSRMVIR